MRRWPRGVRKDAVDHWMRDLAPSVELLRAYRAGEVDWDAFAARYLEEMREQAAAIDEVAETARASGVTLLCGSHPEERCHRSLLASLVRERLLH